MIITMVVMMMERMKGMDYDNVANNMVDKNNTDDDDEST